MISLSIKELHRGSVRCNRNLVQPLLIALALMSALAHSALAQVKFQPAKTESSIVTILSDGLSEPAGGASQILADISAAFDKESEMRLLSINGRGGPANVRDLLQLRGTDLAILNHDVLAYPDLAATLPDARKKVRFIAPLFHQSVLLFARQNIKSIDELRGRKIGVPANRPSRGVTARALFGSLKITAEFVELDEKDLANGGANIDAVLLYEKDLPSLRTLGITPASHHLVPITVAGPLTSVYLPKKLSKDAIAGYTPADSFQTIEVTTLLAAFDWNSKQGRYADVVNFVSKFFALVPQIRVRTPNSPFRTTDVRASVPGWKRFEPAEALAAVASAPPAIKESAPLVASSPEAPPAADALKVIAVARPPLTDPQDANGGLTVKILTSALSAAGVPVSLQWVDSDKALLGGLTSKSADAALFWQTPHCDTPTNQSATEAQVCDHTVISEPLMQATLGVFTRIDTPLDPNGPDAAQARTICVPENQTIPDEALAAIPWTKAGTIKTFRPKTLIDCLAAVDSHEVDALIAIEPEARFAIERLKLTQTFQISQRPNATTGLHILVAKDNPRHTQLIQSLNDALAKFRSSAGYSAIMSAHLSDLTRMPMR